MNRKGFTLMELLAVILVIGIILVIAAPNISSAYKNSKLKSEEIFVERLSDIIDSYVKLNSGELYYAPYGEGTKKEGNTTYKVTLSKGTTTIEDIINDKLLSSEKYVNSGNKEVTCNVNAEIEVYKDTDYVYCHKVKKESLGCLTDDYKNSITGDYVIDTCIWEEVE